MAYPCLIPKWALNASVHVCISSGLNEDGEEMADFEADLDCNLQFKSSQKLTEKNVVIDLSGKACFIGDICPDLPLIKGGTLTFNGETYDIFKGQKSLNFDGTVNYTELELM